MVVNQIQLPVINSKPMNALSSSLLIGEMFEEGGFVFAFMFENFITKLEAFSSKNNLKQSSIEITDEL